MIGYMSPQEQTDADFASARRKALLRRLLTRLHNGRGSGRLPCFEEVRKIPGAVGGVRRGRRTVPLGQIAGSVGRCSEFDGVFLPAKASVRERWKRIDRAFYQGEKLPPVSLYKIGGAYFVLDGHHRVSVARYHGVEWIDADVTEFSAPSGIPSPVEPTVPELSGRGDPKMRVSMFDFEIWKQHREERMREAEQNRLAKEIRDSRERRGSDRVSVLEWELKRIAGRSLKLLRKLRKAG